MFEYVKYILGLSNNKLNHHQFRASGLKQQFLSIVKVSGQRVRTTARTNQKKNKIKTPVDLNISYQLCFKPCTVSLLKLMIKYGQPEHVSYGHIATIYI